MLLPLDPSSPSSSLPQFLPPSHPEMLPFLPHPTLSFPLQAPTAALSGSNRWCPHHRSVQGAASDCTDDLAVLTGVVYLYLEHSVGRQ